MIDTKIPAGVLADFAKALLTLGAVISNKEALESVLDTAVSQEQAEELYQKATDMLADAERKRQEVWAAEQAAVKVINEARIVQNEIARKEQELNNYAAALDKKDKEQAEHSQALVQANEECAALSASLKKREEQIAAGEAVVEQGKKEVEDMKAEWKDKIQKLAGM